MSSVLPFCTTKTITLRVESWIGERRRVCAATTRAIFFAPTAACFCPLMGLPHTHTPPPPVNIIIRPNHPLRNMCRWCLFRRSEHLAAFAPKPSLSVVQYFNISSVPIGPSAQLLTVHNPKSRVFRPFCPPAFSPSLPCPSYISSPSLSFVIVP